jgi:hypothetical protein
MVAPPATESHGCRETGSLGRLAPESSFADDLGRVMAAYIRGMTATQEPKAATSGGADDLEAMTARVQELQAQLRSQSRKAAKAEQHTREQHNALVAVLGAVAVVTTPLAFLTIRRWVHWWAE